MFQHYRKITLFLLPLLLCLNTFSQNPKKNTFFKKNSSDFKGFGIGFEYYSGHKKMSKLFKWKRIPIEEYKTGKGLYITYFNLNDAKKLHYYIHGGLVFWNNQQINNNQTLEQRSGLIQFTGSYKIGRFRLIGRLGGLLNHNTINTITNSETSITKDKKFDLATGLGVSIPIPLKSTKGLAFKILINRVNQHYTWSGTIVLPLVFIN